MPIKKHTQNNNNNNNKLTYGRQHVWIDNDYESSPGPTTTVNEEESFFGVFRRGVESTQHQKGVTCILLLQRRCIKFNQTPFHLHHHTHPVHAAAAAAATVRRLLG